MKFYYMKHKVVMRSGILPWIKEWFIKGDLGSEALP